MSIINKIKLQGFLPLITNINENEFINFINACVLAKITVIEYAARDINAEKIFISAINYIKKNKLDITIGIGTMLYLYNVKKFLELGANFIVCPNINPEIGNYCLEKNIPWIPGASTATELQFAHSLGASIIKVFPADCLGGPNFIKSILGPLNHLQLMPTGGVTTDYETLKKWFQAKVCCVGIGSNLINKTEFNDTEIIFKKLSLLSENIIKIKHELNYK